MSSETLLFDMRWRANGAERSGRFVARLPPPADAFPLFPRYDFDMQVGVMRLVGSRSDIAVPRVPWQERGSEALGAPFFVMEHIDGEMVPDNPPYVFGGWLAGATAAQQDTVQQELLRVLAGVHGIEVEEVFGKLVGVLGFDAKGCQHRFRKIPLIESDDDAGIAADRGGEHMPVIGIRQVQARHENIMAGDQGIGNGTIHQG